MAAYHRRNTYRLPTHDYSDSRYAYFITLQTKIKAVEAQSSIDPARPFISCRPLGTQADRSLHFYREQGKWLIFAYSLMPNHLHLLVSPLGGANLSNILGSYESYTTRLAWEHGVVGPLWQRSFYDHILRSEQAAINVVNYILNNPVRARLVKRWEDWPWCGAPDPL